MIDRRRLLVESAGSATELHPAGPRRALHPSVDTFGPSAPKPLLHLRAAVGLGRGESVGVQGVKIQRNLK